MAGAVLSVEHFVFNIASTERIDDTASVGELGLSQTMANCVPFVTNMVTDNAMVNDPSAFQVDIYFEPSNDRVVAERDNTDGAVEVHVAVVEFDDTRCNVYGGGPETTGDGKWTQPDSGDGITTVTLGTDIVIANTFLVNHSYQNSGTGPWASHMFRSQITAVDTLKFQRVDWSGTADGHWYLVESISGQDFTVEAVDVQLASQVTTNTATVTAASEDLSKLYLIGSAMSTDEGGVNDQCTYECALTTNTVTVNRAYAAVDSVLDWTGFLVTTKDGSLVERGTTTQDPADAQEDITITSVVVADSVATLTGNYGSLFGGSFDGIASDDLPDAPVALSFVGSPSSTTLRVEHDIGGGGAPSVISWEVITWGTGAAVPRRVMVRG